jgi:cold shock CspA family protein/DNA-directed RNA polymerase subunit RPC12/RpoP
MVQGKVKWFSSEKGYGFITVDNDEDFYFHVSNICGSSLPNNGDLVSFEPKTGKKGLKAQNVVIKPQNYHKERQGVDERVDCPGCSKKIVPRLVFQGGEPVKSVCPYCAATVKRFEKDKTLFVVVAIIIVIFIIAMS